jgi:hypothetical protein
VHPVDPFGMERPPSVASKVVEFVAYLWVLNTSFVQVGGRAIPYFGAGVLFLTAGLAFIVARVQGDRLARSVWFILAMNVAATVSQLSHGQLPIVGDGLRELFNWLCEFIIFSYLVRNAPTRHRVVLVYCVVILVSYQLAGAVSGVGYKRAALKEGIVGGGFGNGNDLAYIATTFIVALLFWSLSAPKLLRPILWIVGAGLVYVVVATVSRGAMLALGTALSLLLVTVLLGRGVRGSGLVLVCAAVIGISQGLVFLEKPLDTLERRFKERSIRTKVYNSETVNDLAKTLVFGRGTKDARTTANRLSAHNTFLNLHLVFGGPMAWIYLGWIAMLSRRLWRMFWAKDYPFHIKMEVIACFGVSLTCQLLSNYGVLATGSVYTMALVDFVTMPYAGRRRLRSVEMPQLVAGMSEGNVVVAGGS